MAVLTVHRWSDRARGLAELARVARNCVVIFTFDSDHPGTWLGDYLPQLRELDRQQMPPLTAYRAPSEM
jgi:hypothetical protein